MRAHPRWNHKRTHSMAGKLDDSKLNWQQQRAAVATEQAWNFGKDGAPRRTDNRDHVRYDAPPPLSLSASTASFMSPPRSPSPQHHRKPLTSPAIEQLRSEIKEMEQLVWEESTGNATFSASGRAVLRPAEDQLWIRPNTGGYARPASASSLRRHPSSSLADLHLDEPVHHQYPPHLQHLEQLASAQQLANAQLANREPERQEGATHAERSPSRPCSAKQHYSGPPPAFSPKHYMQPELEPPAAMPTATVARRPASASMMRPASTASLHMPRPSSAVLRYAAAGGVVPRSNSAAELQTRRPMSRPASAVSLLSSGTVARSRPHHRQLQQHSKVAAQPSVYSAANLIRRVGHQGARRYAKSPSGFEIGEALQQMTELQNVRGLPVTRVNRRHYDASGDFHYNLSPAARAGLTPAPRGLRTWDATLDLKPGVLEHEPLDDSDHDTPRFIARKPRGCVELRSHVQVTAP